ncbi:MAG: energy transducer TonB [Tenuifilaceae bacterium]
MSKYLIIIALFLLQQNLFSQELKRKTKSTMIYKEIFFIDKSTKKKNGSYIKISIAKKDTLIKGSFRNDIKTETWYFYGNKNLNKPYIKYDFDTKKFVSYSDSISLNDTFYVRTPANKYVLTNVDSPPIYLGYKNEIREIIASTIKIPEVILRNGLNGTSIISFIIGKDGTLKDFQVTQKFESLLENSLIKILSNLEGTWIPAYYNGFPIESKIILMVSINENPFGKIDKPYIWHILFSFSKSISI